MKTDKYKGPICTLTYGGQENVTLDLPLSGDQKVTLQATGPNNAYLSGYLQPLLDEEQNVELATPVLNGQSAPGPKFTPLAGEESEEKNEGKTKKGSPKKRKLENSEQSQPSKKDKKRRKAAAKAAAEAAKPAEEDSDSSEDEKPK